nr:cysteine--tRNA ligase [Xenococcaceae cyanobacterium MO_188.B19]
NILVHEGKTEADSKELESQWRTLVELAAVLGFAAQLEAETDSNSNGLTDAAIEALIEQRKEARKSKNWSESDRIRDELKAQGIALIDTKEGTTWHRG